MSSFNTVGAGTNISCLVLASLSLTLPSVFTSIPDVTLHDSVMTSRIISVMLVFVYLMFLIFQLLTHTELFSSQEEEEEEEAVLAPSISCVLLFVTTLAVALCSDFLVDSIQEVSEKYGLPYGFIGLILLPIVGNAAEHTTAVTSAYKGMMNLALGVAVGSATQIALFVMPFSVLVGWVYDVPMTLDFKTFDAAVFILSVFIASTVLGDGSSNWFEGAMLVATYIIVAIFAWFLPESYVDATG